MFHNCILLWIFIKPRILRISTKSSGHTPRPAGISVSSCSFVVKQKRVCGGTRVSPRSLSLRCQLINFPTCGKHLVESIKHGTAIDIHPSKERLYLEILRSDITRVNSWLAQVEADGFVVRQSVAQRVHLVQFVEYIGLVVLNLCR